MDKVKHDILKMLSILLSEEQNIARKLEILGDMVEDYVPITNISCEVCGEKLYEVKDKYVCLKCKRVIDNQVLKGGG